MIQAAEIHDDAIARLYSPAAAAVVRIARVRAGGYQRARTAAAQRLHLLHEYIVDLALRHAGADMRQCV